MNLVGYLNMRKKALANNSIARTVKPITAEPLGEPAEPEGN